MLISEIPTKKKKKKKNNNKKQTAGKYKYLYHRLY